MKRLLPLLGLSVVGCAQPHYTVTIYEKGSEVTTVGVATDLAETMVVVRDNQTGNWAAIPGSAVHARLYPKRVQPTTHPAE